MKRLYFHPVKYLCNKSCSFCITKQQFNKNSKFPQFINIYTLNDISQYIFDMYDEIEITGGGEPTLHPEFDDIIYILSQYNNIKKRLYLKLYTNGTKLHIINNIRINEVTISYENINQFFNTVHALEKYDISTKIRARIYCESVSEIYSILLMYMSKLHKIANRLNIADIILGLEFNQNAAAFTHDIDYYENNSHIHIDLHTKKCPEYNLLYTDSKIYDTWETIWKNQ